MIDELTEIESEHKKENGKLRKEIEEKTTIIFAGAEKVKMLEKEIAELKIQYISDNLNNNIKQKQKEDEQLSALNEGWKIELKDTKEKLEIAVAMLTKGQYPSKNEKDNDFDYQFISRKKIEEKIKEYNDFFKRNPEAYRKGHCRVAVVILKELLESE